MTVADRIKYRREELGYTQSELADKVGYSDKTSISKIENSGNDISMKKLRKIADALSVSVSYLMGWENGYVVLDPLPEYDIDKDDSHRHNLPPRKIPVLGRVAAGIPLEMIEDIVDDEEIPGDMVGEYFALKIKGDSMEPKISNGDVVIVRQQPDVESGQIAIVTVNGDDATCKRVMKYAEGLMLISNNPKYAPMQFSKEEIENKPIRILGKVVELRAKFE